MRFFSHGWCYTNCVFYNPKAELRAILYDFQGNYITEQYIALSTTSTNTWQELKIENWQVPENGILQVMSANSSNVAVYFDDMSVELQETMIVQETHYYPFGGMISGIGKQGNHEYTYNGKEKEDDFEVGWYDYGQRNYMKDLGKFFNVDKMAEKYDQFSPYHYTANNPVKHIEVDGNFFTGNIWQVEKVKREAERKKQNLEQNISSNMNTMLSSTDLGQIATLATQISRDANQLNQFNETLSELETLEKSDQEYHITSIGASPTTGSTGWNNNRIEISVLDTHSEGLIAHELKHAFQFEMGITGYGAGKGGTERTYPSYGNHPALSDASDEVEAYKRQFLFDPMSLPRQLQGNNVENITMNNVLTIPIYMKQNLAAESRTVSLWQNRLTKATEEKTLQGVYQAASRPDRHKIAFRRNGITYANGKVMKYTNARANMAKRTEGFGKK